MKYLILLLGYLTLFNVVNGQTNFVRDTGNVGIGTLAPKQKLEIAANGAAYEQLTNNWDVLGTVGAIKFNMAGTEIGSIESERVVPTGRLGTLKFSVRTANGLSEGLRIGSNGLVGIGVTSPQAGLQVANVNILADGTRVAAVLGNAWNDWTAFGGTGGGKIRGSNEGYLMLETNPTGSDNVLGLNQNSPGKVLIAGGGGNVGIGTSTPQAKLAVNGDIFAKKIKVTLIGWPDYVFEPTYALPTLQAVESFLTIHKHLPEMPSAAEVKANGIDVGENQAKLLQKIEELTLYLIDLNKKVASQEQLLLEQRKELMALKQQKTK
ncbi:hypothetical protein [Chitinophaga nivalis]|uniref:BZIP transcription factor n=1 Tax=Chitinophaga nivalis TaxID=2991709 RepID=A0ABT3IJP5_9BACT|nr:hypothetical protein [Chitinophaga nivalis]MCW3466132.1 hypothetical protein [Chitinophaga nivalis]MCW3484177.1 hypothetical protein [Chitinophaga nivalis]